MKKARILIKSYKEVVKLFYQYHSVV